MSDERDPSAWVAKAEEDYAVARACARHKPVWAYGACFHAQQCAEKYLKAILVAREQSFPRIHDLLRLSALSEAAGIALPMDTTRLDTLSFYAVLTRYPGETPTLDEAREAVKIAQEVRRFARRTLGLRR
jgi:HEPN domain-containing protein